MPLTKNQQKEQVAALHARICRIVEEDLKLTAIVSYMVCEEIIIHHDRDIERLYAIHHEFIHPTKHCSYLAFWIRKLKPISSAIPTSVMVRGDLGEILDSEDTDVNETVAIHYALELLEHYLKNTPKLLPSGMKKDDFPKKFAVAIKSFFAEVTDVDKTMGNRLKVLVYDLRYRTFGPHHMTHVLSHLLRETFNGDISK